MNEPDIVYLERSGEHNNHIPGTYDDLKFMRLSTHIRKNIENVLHARAIIEDDLLHNTRDSFIHYDNIYNIYAKIMKELFKFDENDMSSLENEGCSVLRHQSEHTYYCGFQIEWQKALMLQSVSLVVRNPKTGYGNSVVYLITNNHSVEPIKDWLVFFKQRNVMNPSQITVDCSIPEIDAIRVVFGDVCKIHRNLLTKVKTASTMTNETVKQVVKRTRGLTFAELKTIMYEVDPTAVKQKIEGFQNRWIRTQREFVNYVIDIWVNTFGCENWTAAFMQEAFNYMRTNNYIESWHNQLKSKYLKRIKNHRLDRLIYVLYVDVEKDMKLEEQRVELEVGRMGPSVRQRRRREILADKIPADEREKMVE
ncbi:MAG: hypothetical protein EXX96DRAFT_598697 [Benjaminiella poitrasii]|nr:MAG: hypothetical protein EXX96DRAFT_598697 [Benjaminiella poitrasii]